MIRLLLPLILLIVSACTPPPRSELQAARMAVTRAYHSGAEDLAPEEYRLAVDALRRGEQLLREQNFEEAKGFLPQAESYARQAQARARLEKDRLEKIRIEEEESARQAKISPTPSVMKPLPTPTPPPSAPVHPKPLPPPSSPPSVSLHAPLARYTVGESETLWNISAREDVYGDPLLWPLLYQANRDQIRDPRRLYRGQVLTIPRGLSSAEMEDAREKARRSDIFPVDRSRPPAPRSS